MREDWDDLRWSRLTKETDGRKEVLLLGLIYIIPRGSSAWSNNINRMKDAIEQLAEIEGQESQDLHVLLGGEFNARLGEKKYYIVNDEKEYGPMPEDYLPYWS